VLKRLWKMSEEIKKERGSPFISYEELVEIQKLWIREEGDYNNLSVMKITGLDITNDIDMEFVEFCKKVDESIFLLRSNSYSREYRGIPFVKIPVSERFISVLVAELLKSKKSIESFLWLHSIMIDDYFNEHRNKAHLELMGMGIYTKIFFPTTCEEEIIQQEWKNDELSFNSYLREELYKDVVHPDDVPYTLDGTYEKKYVETKKEYNMYGKQHKQYRELEEKGDITQCESISLQDQMAFFDNW
jgi:hypothetical protein